MNLRNRKSTRVNTEDMCKYNDNQKLQGTN